MEDAEDIGAGVDNGKAVVVCRQNPVGAVGSNWERKKGQKKTVKGAKVCEQNKSMEIN